MREWDPIGVKDQPMAADEYDSYIGGVYELLKNRAAAKVISDHLREIEIKRMGFENSSAGTLGHSHFLWHNRFWLSENWRGPTSVGPLEQRTKRGLSP